MSSFEEILGYLIHILIKNDKIVTFYLNFLLAELETLLSVQKGLWFNLFTEAKTIIWNNRPNLKMMYMYVKVFMHGL